MTRKCLSGGESGLSCREMNDKEATPGRRTEKRTPKKRLQAGVMKRLQAGKPRKGFSERDSRPVGVRNPTKNRKEVSFFSFFVLFIFIILLVFV